MNETPAELYQRLRIETAALLGFDLSNLSAAQGARLDRATMLRWELDRMAGSQVRGDAIDVSRAVAASEALERLLSPTASFDGEVHESHHARAKLAALYDSIAEVLVADKDARVAELEAALAEKDQVIAEKTSTIVALGGATGKRVEEFNRAGPPRGHLKGPAEPWRPFVDEGGIRSNQR
jgi:hypothetical protein